MLQLPTWPPENKALLLRLLPVGRRAGPRALSGPPAGPGSPAGHSFLCQGWASVPSLSLGGAVPGGLALRPSLPQLQPLAEVLGVGSAQRLFPRVDVPLGRVWSPLQVALSLPSSLQAEEVLSTSPRYRDQRAPAGRRGDTPLLGLAAGFAPATSRGGLGVKQLLLP